MFEYSKSSETQLATTRMQNPYCISPVAKGRQRGVTACNGIDGTPMAPWSNELSEAELSAVAYFVRGFFEGVPDR